MLLSGQYGNMNAKGSNQTYKVMPQRVFSRTAKRMAGCRTPMLTAGGGQQSCLQCTCCFSSCCSSRKEDYSHRTPKQGNKDIGESPHQKSMRVQYAEAEDHGAVMTLVQMV